MKKNQLDITSHFIGVKLVSSMFISLYVEIQAYLKNNNIDAAICLSDIHSLHLTLYYLGQALSPAEINIVQKMVKDMEMSELKKSIHINELHFFTKNSFDTLSYLTTKEDKILTSLNKILGTTLKKIDIADNLLQYIPHCTLFTIQQKEVYAEHKSELVKIIDRYISTIKDENVYEVIEEKTSWYQQKDFSTGGVLLRFKFQYY